MRAHPNPQTVPFTVMPDADAGFTASHSKSRGAYQDANALDQGRTMGEECGLSCATAPRGARRSYSSTEPAEVVATMRG